jgi:hypothetical protein
MLMTGAVSGLGFERARNTAAAARRPNDERKNG